MTPKIWGMIKNNAGVIAALGNPPRAYSFGNAPQTVQKPYATWQLVNGLPENYLGNLPDVDDFTVQIDVWAGDGDTAEACAKALRDALEPHGYVDAWRGETRDKETGDYGYSFDVSFLTYR